LGTTSEQGEGNFKKRGREEAQREVWKQERGISSQEFLRERRDGGLQYVPDAQRSGNYTAEVRRVISAHIWGAIRPKSKKGWRTRVAYVRGRGGWAKLPFPCEKGGGKKWRYLGDRKLVGPGGG